jgi:predicted RNA-binding Zn-ribbon protein involved in translation (DUF1610 family)
MEPNYSEYSIAELEGSLKTIDQEAYPDRTEKLKHELNSRQKTTVSYSETIEDELELNEQFFRCPSCEKKIGFFSKTANKWGKKKTCPHCNSPFETTVKLKVFAIALIPMFVVHLFLLKPLVESFGLNGAISVGIIGGILSILAMRYRKIWSSNVT